MPNRKLTEEQVIAIRHDDRSNRTIATEYCVHNTTIGNIKNYRVYKEVQDPDSAVDDINRVVDAAQEAVTDAVDTVEDTLEDWDRGISEGSWWRGNMDTMLIGLGVVGFVAFVIFLLLGGV